MRARVGSRTSVTKVVAPRSCTVCGTFSGFAIHLMSAGMKFSMSLLVMSAQSFSIVLYAFFFTSGLVSHIASEMTGRSSATCEVVLSLCTDAKDFDTFEVGHLLRPFLRGADGSDDVWNDRFDSVGVDGLGDGEGSVLRSHLYRCHLVSDSIEYLWEDLHEVRFDERRDVGVLCNVGDGLARVLPCVRIFLIGQHLLECIHGLSRSIFLLDIAVDECGDLLGCFFRLITDFRD